MNVLRLTLLSTADILGALPELGILGSSFLAVCMSVRMEQLGSHYTDFCKL